MVAKNRRPIQSGAVRVAFFARKRITDVPVQSFNTPRGTILVSTPEATALDLVGYYQRAGGLDQVATVLAELAERIDPEKLAIAAETAPVSWAQRLGYLMERVEANSRTEPLSAYVERQAQQATPLLSTIPHDKSSRDERWKLYVNADVEAEL